MDIHANSTTKNINYHFGKLFSIFTDYLVVLKSDEEISKEKIFWLTHPKNHSIHEHAQEMLENIEDLSGEILESLESLEDSFEESLESLESSEELIDQIEGFFYDGSESIEDLFSSEKIENITKNLNDIPRFTIMKEDCEPNGCTFLFAGSDMSDQAIGKKRNSVSLSK